MDIAQLLVSGFPSLSTGNISDAGHGATKVMDFGIKPFEHSVRVAGPAFTVETPPDSNLFFHEALTLAPVGSVIVVNAHGNMTSGHMGDLMALACQTRGIAGVVIDGAVRDIDGMVQLNFPIFSRGGVAHGNAAKRGVMNQTIQCGGVEVNPGDMIFGDATGVVVFPQSKAQEIYDKATRIANSELGFIQQLNEGKTLLQIPEFLKLHNIDPDELKSDGVDVGE
jgi:4-hydroxy-4-methyl-2-oxoglutarate aldolase